MEVSQKKKRQSLNSIGLKTGTNRTPEQKMNEVAQFREPGDDLPANVWAPYPKISDAQEDLGFAQPEGTSHTSEMTHNPLLTLPNLVHFI